jgi:hypothetical protein
MHRFFVRELWLARKLMELSSQEEILVCFHRLLNTQQSRTSKENTMETTKTTYERERELFRAVFQLPPVRDYVKDAEQEISRLQSVNTGLLDALKYSRRFLEPGEHDCAFVDSSIKKAEGTAE